LWVQKELILIRGTLSLSPKHDCSGRGGIQGTRGGHVCTWRGRASFTGNEKKTVVKKKGGSKTKWHGGG